MPLRILLNGYKGRMGQAIIAAATAADVEIVARLDAGDRPSEKVIADAEVVIDFSAPSATAALAKLVAKHGKALVIGTTGHSPAERKAVLAAIKNIPVVWAGNYSIGVNLLNYLVQQAATTLGPSAPVEIVEMHHRHKKDAPSGTAEKLIEIVRAAQRLPASAVVHGRQGLVGPRPEAQIGVHSLRGGDVVGDHTVIFAAEGERLELTHKASNRSIFAVGALRAAQWLAGRPAGLYGMADVLGLKA